MEMATQPASAPLAVERLSAAKHKNIAWFLLYLLLLGGVARHLYRYPAYRIDSLGYMGNALLFEETDPVKIHSRVYAEVARLPKGTRDAFTGIIASGSEEQDRSRQERAVNPYRSAEFFPFFAIRPLYVRILYWTSKTGLGLTRASVLISVVAYFLLGIVVYVWVAARASGLVGLAASWLVMITPPLLILGRDNTSDGLSTLVAFFALYLIFQTRLLSAGLALLLISIYFRTDNVVLAAPVLLLCWLEHKLDFWKAALLGVVALVSALAITHFAGDYGIKMLYYRNFIGTPLAPAEATVNFSVRDYFSALGSGASQAAAGFFLPFLLLGIRGLLVPGPLRGLAAATTAYVLLHFVVLPNWQERWFGIFYLSMAVAAASGMVSSADSAAHS